MTLPFFTSLLILLIVARVFGEVFERFNQPSMLGEILAGVLLGPSLLGIIQPTEAINVIADLGVFLLIILAGLEIEMKDILKSLKGYNFMVPLFAFLIPFLSGFVLGELFEMTIVASILMGLCISITALPVSVRVLMDMGILKTDTGQKILSAAIVQDIFALTILGIVVNMPAEGFEVKTLVITTAKSVVKLTVFIGFLAFAYYISNRLAKKSNIVEETFNKLIGVLKGKESLLAITFLFVLIFSSVAETLGFHFIVGAFFASMLIQKNIVGEENHANITKTMSGMTMGFLSPIFFAYIGLEVNLLSLQNVWLLLATLVVSYVSKIFGGFIGGKMARLSNAKSLAIGIGLNGRGIMEIIIANIAYSAGLINAELFSIVILMSITTVITLPFMLKWSYKKIDERER